MEGRETYRIVAYPLCYGCHKRIDSNASIMATQKFLFPFHENCFYEYIEKFRRIAPAIEEGVQGEENARIAH